jgi:predicted kinase
VIVDAAFLRRNQRQDFYALARSAGARCIRIECNAPRRVLEQRIRARATAPNVSEADEAVLDYQLTRRETASAAEDAVVIQIDTTGEVDLPRLVERILEGSQHKTRDPRSE